MAARLLAVALCATAAAYAEDVRITAQHALAAPAPPRDATHALALHVYLFAGTSWREADVAGAVSRAAALLAQCGIATLRIDAATIDAPPRLRDFDTPASRALVRAISPRKPALFFVQATRSDPAFDAEAIGVSNAQRRPELANTVWVAYGARDLAHAIAHELVHVLSDSGEHSDALGNLMRDETSPENAALTAEQCARMRSRGAANGLLTLLH